MLVGDGVLDGAGGVEGQWVRCSSGRGVKGDELVLKEYLRGD